MFIYPHVQRVLLQCRNELYVCGLDYSGSQPFNYCDIADAATQLQQGLILIHSNSCCSDM